MIEDLLGLAVFLAYVAIVSLALVLAVVVFRTGGDGSGGDGSGGDGSEGHRPSRARFADRSRSWWQRWR